MDTTKNLDLRLTRDDWMEIYYALDTKAGLLENGEYGACEHGEDCADCNQEWERDLRAIMNKIGQDGTLAAQHGVAKA